MSMLTFTRRICGKNFGILGGSRVMNCMQEVRQSLHGPQVACSPTNSGSSLASRICEAGHHHDCIVDTQMLAATYTLYKHAEDSGCLACNKHQLRLVGWAVHLLIRMIRFQI